MDKAAKLLEMEPSGWYYHACVTACWLVQIWTWIGLGSFGSEDICSTASQISWRWLPISEGPMRKAGDGRCWHHPLPCQGSYVQSWWVRKDRIWYPFGCGEVTSTTEMPCFTTPISSTPSLKELGCVIAGAWRRLACFWVALSLGADTICCCFLKWLAWQWRNVLVPFPPGGGSKLMFLMLHLTGEPISPDAFTQ